MNKKLSVIIFVYSGEQVAFCLQSILNQQLTLSEILIVTSGKETKRNVLQTLHTIRANLESEDPVKIVIRKREKYEDGKTVRRLLKNAHGSIVFLITEYCILSRSYLAKAIKLAEANVFVFSSKIDSGVDNMPRQKLHRFSGLITRKRKLYGVTLNDDMQTVRKLIRKRVRSLCIINPLLPYVIPKKKNDKNIHYPYWLVERSAKKVDSFWTVLALDPIAFRLTWFFANYTSVTPNKITLISIVFGIIAIYFLLSYQHISLIIGSLMLTLSHLMDCVDGKLARITYKESVLGAFIDAIKDRIFVLFSLAAVSYSFYVKYNSFELLYIAIILVIAGSHSRLFALYYHYYKRGAKTLTKARFIEVISEEKKTIITDVLVKSILSIRNALRQKRIKIVPTIYDVEMMAFLFGSLLFNLKLMLSVAAFFSIMLFVVENTIRIMILKKIGTKK